MDEYVLINGRPYGGVAILWNRCMTYRVAPVEYSSTRICAVIVYLDNDDFFLLICVYMPCDDRRRGHNLNEFIDILNDISIICNYADVNYVCIAGDLNTDLNRSRYQTNELSRYVDEQGWLFCINDPCSEVDFTFCSKGFGTRSLIDHFILSDNAMCMLDTYTTIDDVNNCSDHVAVKCTFDYAVHLNVISMDGSHDDSPSVGRPAWHNATENDIRNYKCKLTELLDRVRTPSEALYCTYVNCTNHSDIICTFYDNIMTALVRACEETIPKSIPSNCKSVPGWSEFVNDYFITALFWHKIWTENDRPAQGIIADIRRDTRKKYHKACKMAKRHAGLIACNKMAQAISCNCMGEFWKQTRRFRKHKVNHSKTVDGIEGEHEIAGLFSLKYKELFNAVSYDEEVMTILHKIILMIA